MKLSNMSSYYSSRKQRMIINNQEQLVKVPVIIHYNPAIPRKHRMLR